MKKKVLLWIQAALCVLLFAQLASVFLGIYLEGSAARAAGDVTALIFTREKLGQGLLRALPLLASNIAFLLCCLAAGLSGEKAGRPVLTRSLARDPSFFLMRPSADGDAGRSPAVLRAALLVLAAVLIVHGVFNGSLLDVLYKAINICTECIGLG